MASNNASRPMGIYNEFDSIAEPGRRQQPMFMRRVKTRRSKMAILGSIICLLLLVWGWRSSGISITPRAARFSNARLSTIPQIPISHELASGMEAPLMAPPMNATPSGLQKTSPSFHLLIPASKSSPNLCKTLLSSFVLSYPPPTLINHGQEHQDGGDKSEAGSHTAKIRGVFDFLNDKSKTKDDDLVLIIDGYDIWFQLPPNVMLRRYHAMIKEANERLRNRYGMISQEKVGNEAPDRVPRYTQRVIFGADKICWPNPKEDPACAAVPYSTLPKDVYGPETDKDPQAFLNRPRYLNSGTVIGPAADLRALYAYAVSKVEEKGRGGIGDQFVLAEIFGEQEFQRETLRRASQGTMGLFQDWLSDTLGTSESPLSANITINNVTTIPGQRYEYALSLDYEAQLFQTMTHSPEDVEFITYNSTRSLKSIQSAHPAHHSLPLYLPADLRNASPPFSYASPGNQTPSSYTNTKTLLLPYSSKLDDLPGMENKYEDPYWHTVPLATNIHSASIPTLLHFNGDKSLLDTWWPKLWFHPYARALLRRYVRSTQTATAAIAAARGGEDWFDRRGGRGGVWTSGGDWMGWGEVCKGVEDEVFGDGKGVWGKEDGSGRVVNAFGKVLVGEDEE